MHIDELHLPTNSLPAQREFYANTLGFSVLDSPAHSLKLQAGRSQLIFMDAPTGGDSVYHFAFNIPPDAFAEAKEWLMRRVPLIKSNTGEDEFDFSNWNAHAFYFRDPAGNIVEFIARHDLPIPSKKQEFSAQSIISISEIGLAAIDVPGTVFHIEEQIPVKTYDGEGSDTFTAVGDVNGLFIVVKEGRTWFPDTGKEARLLPVKAVVTVDGGERYMLSGPPYMLSRL